MTTATSTGLAALWRDAGGEAGLVEANGTRIWVERSGQGSDVLLLAGLGDSVEAWSCQLAGLSATHRLTAIDNRGSGRTSLPDGPLSVELMAHDAAAVLDELGIQRAHVLGFSGGSLIAQELALHHPERVRSLVLDSTYGRLDSYGKTMVGYWRWMLSAAPGERQGLEAFYLWVYTPAAHADGTVDRLIDEVMAFPYPQSVEAFLAQLEAFYAHDTLDRLHRISAPTLVLAGEVDICTRPALGRQVAELIPGARFELVPGQAHQPFQEIPEWFNARVSQFWRELEQSGR